VKKRPRQEFVLNAQDWQGHHLMVRFDWCGDRYSHSVSAVRRDSRRLLLESLEGGADDIWPSSPPIQELSDCTIVSDTNRGQATLLVGAAGKSHWAMTLSLRDYWIGQGRRKFETDILFDVACRVAEAPEWLGSSYRVLCGQVAVSQQLGQALMPADSPECLITSDKATVKLETSSGPYPIIRYDAPVTSIESLPDTVRWRYAMRLCAEEP